MSIEIKVITFSRIPLLLYSSALYQFSKRVKCSGSGASRYSGSPVCGWGSASVAACNRWNGSACSLYSAGPP